MRVLLILASTTLIMLGCTRAATDDDRTDKQALDVDWRIDFFDDFDDFNTENWQDQMLWVNDEDQCYVPDNQFNTREVSDGALKLRVIDLKEKRPCDNMDKTGKRHHDTQYVAGRIASKNRKEFVKGRWTARLKVENLSLIHI